GLTVVFVNATVSQNPRREEEIIEVVLRCGHRFVGEIHQHHDYSHRAAKRTSVESRASNHSGRGSGRILVERDDDTVVESKSVWLDTHPQETADGELFLPPELLKFVLNPV